MEVLISNYNFLSSQESSQEEDIADIGCGQATVNCIADAYANHGWVSVWFFIQSALLPQTVVAIAAACAAKNNCL